jgi:flagellar basal-body rod protein FlgC
VSSIFSIAQSGLQANTLRLAVSADNVANTLTEGFVPSRVVQGDVAGGGVEAKVVKNDPQHEAQIDRAIVGLSSGTELGSEMVGQMTTASAFKANVESLRTADDLLATLMQIHDQR